MRKFQDKVAGDLEKHATRCGGKEFVREVEYYVLDHSEMIKYRCRKCHMVVASVTSSEHLYAA